MYSTEAGKNLQCTEEGWLDLVGWFLLIIGRFPHLHVTIVALLHFTTNCAPRFRGLQQGLGYVVSRDRLGTLNLLTRKYFCKLPLSGFSGDVWYRLVTDVISHAIKVISPPRSVLGFAVYGGSNFLSGISTSPGISSSSARLQIVAAKFGKLGLSWGTYASAKTRDCHGGQVQIPNLGTNIGGICQCQSQGLQWGILYQCQSWGLPKETCTYAKAGGYQEGTCTYANVGEGLFMQHPGWQWKYKDHLNDMLEGGGDELKLIAMAYPGSTCITRDSILFWWPRLTFNSSVMKSPFSEKFIFKC